LEAKRYEEARDLLREGLELHPANASLLYNLACAEALLGEKDAALEHLAGAVENPRFREFAETDSDFDSLRDDPRFTALVSPPA
jgi:Flp pilus assembly protein TadD